MTVSVLLRVGHQRGEGLDSEGARKMAEREYDEYRTEDGKTLQQEARDSANMLGVTLGLAFIFYTGLIIWVLV